MLEELFSPMTCKVDALREHLQKQISEGSHLYGRSGEESILLNSYYASLTLKQSAPANMILIRGDSGMGKTKLAEKLRVYAKEDDGYFLRGKFDQQSYGGANVPYSGITNSFREYCLQLKERGEDRGEVVRALKKNFQRNEGSLLCEAIPSLRDICCQENDTFHQESSDDLLSTENRLHRLKYLLKKFIRVISSIGDPIIFLLDDMQWSDASSLDLVKTLAGGAQNPFLFIFTFTYRSVGDCDHPFLQLVESLESRNSVTEITLRGLDENDVDDMVSSSLGHVRSCRSLSGLLCRVTNGNPLLILRQLIALVDNGLIHTDKHSQALVWNVQEIEQSNTLRNLITMTSSKIKRLPAETQTALQISACIGTTIDYEVLGVLAKDICEQNDEVYYNAENDAISIGKDVILSATEEGLLTECQDGGGVSFIHDSVQSSAYALLKSEEQAPFHLRLGLILISKLRHLSSNYLFLTANQLAHGYKLVQGSDRIKVARIFIRAGDESKLTAAFREANFFYAKAIYLLSDEDWLNEYRLCCDAYLNGSETGIWSGNEDVFDWLETVSLRATGLIMDQLRASWIKFHLLTNKGQLEAGIHHGIEDLGSLVGIKLRRKNLKMQTIVALARTRRLMCGHTYTTLLQHSRIVNEEMNFAFRYLNAVALIIAAVKPILLPLVCFKLLELNLKHGISSTMPTAVAWYGIILIHLGFPACEALQYGQIALKLQDDLKCEETRAQIAGLVHGFIEIFGTKKSNLMKRQIHEGYIYGLQAGDIHHAMMCAHLLSSFSFHFGEHLPKVTLTLEQYSRSMVEHNTIGLLGVNKVYEQVVDMLTTPLSLCGKNGLKEISFPCTKVPYEIERMRTAQLLMAYLLDNYNMAWQASEELQCIPRNPSLIKDIAAFFRGMTALQMKMLKKRSLRKVVKSCRNILKKGTRNSQHYAHLLDAEYYATVKRNDLAEEYFSLAIECASMAEVTHIQALAYERFGHYHLICGNEDSGFKMLTTARELYMKWGACLKCDLMERKFKGKLV